MTPTRDPRALRRPLHIGLIVGAGLLGACSRQDVPPPAAAAKPPVAVGAPAAVAATPAPADAGHPANGIAWQSASTDSQVDAAFAQARQEGRPLFVYWGAKWCPPCNQVKATLFNREDFIARSRAFVPVYVDGDSPGAQRLGARFKVSGYPTMVLFSSQGTELTRLPGEVDAARYTEVLTLGMNAQKPVKAVLAQALAGGAGLTPADWRLLAFYSWDTDEQQLSPRGGVAPLLQRLAAGCPADQAETSQRLQLQSLAANGSGSAGSPPAPAPTPATREALLRLLADPNASRAAADVLENSAADIARAATARGTPQRAELINAFDAALKRLQDDATLSRADRLAALYARVDLVRIDLPRPAPGAAPATRAAPVPPMPAPLLADLRETAARDDREITDGYERQAVITAAADTLAHAGLGSESDALLKANLARSHSPYYLMSMLSRHAKDRGDKAEALDWSGKAFESSVGPATRLQWGASYIATLVELAPEDEPRVERVAGELFTEAGRTPDSFYERSGRSLQRVGASLQRWNAGGAHTAALHRLQTRLDAVCNALPAGDPNRSACEKLLKAPAAKVA